jgi:hypothetical protein
MSTATSVYVAASAAPAPALAVIAAATPAPKKSFCEKCGQVLLDIVEFPVKLITWGEKAEKVLATAIKDQPELKDVLTQIVTRAEAIGGAAVAAAGGDGINLTADATVLADAEQFFLYIKSTLVPIVEAIYGEVKADITQ